MTLDAEEKILNLFPIDYPFETLVSRINSKPAKLKLDPDFQRKYKWDKEGWGRASKFIESCLMRIPLPSCYFAEDDDGYHFVIDGVQRLTTISKFLNDEFPLEGMTTFKELENKKFSELGSYRAELETTTIRCIILRKENPKNLVREIFSRLNQGAVKLTDQEIRHAIYPGSFDKLIIDLGAHERIARFGLAEDSDAERDGREAEEQVLRFFAFKDDLGLETYNTNLKDFLDAYMEDHANLTDDEVVDYRDHFTFALDNCIAVFGDSVFTNPVAEKKRKGLIHYDLLMPTVGLLDAQIVKENAVRIAQAYKELCESVEFQSTRSGGLQNKSSIIKRRKAWAALLEKAIND